MSPPGRLASGRRCDLRGANECVAACSCGRGPAGRPGRRAGSQVGCDRAVSPGPAQICDRDPLLLGQVPRRDLRRLRVDRRRIVQRSATAGRDVTPGSPACPVRRLIPTIPHASLLLTPCAINRANACRCSDKPGPARLAAFQAPANVGVAENALRIFARWMLGAGLD